MKKKQLALIIFSLLFIGFFFKKIDSFNSKKEEIDLLDDCLSPMKNILINNSNISLITSKNEYPALYFKTQFVLTPNIIEWNNIDKDTILIIERAGEMKVDFISENYNKILTSSNLNFNTILYSKKH